MMDCTLKMEYIGESREEDLSLLSCSPLVK